MTLKNAALLALIGTILATVLLVWTFVIHCPQCPAGIGSSGNAVPVVRLCVCLLQCGGVLLRVPQSAIVIVAYPPPLRLASSPEYRLCGRSLRTAMPSAFFCPISTSSRLPRVIPV